MAFGGVPCAVTNRAVASSVAAARADHARAERLPENLLRLTGPPKAGRSPSGVGSRGARYRAFPCCPCRKLKFERIDGVARPKSALGVRDLLLSLLKISTGPSEASDFRELAVP